MRLFLAIELPPPVKHHLATIQSILRASLPQLRYIPEQNLHLTLKFLGGVQDSLLPDLISTLRPIPIPQLTLHAEALITFPPRGPLRIVGASLAGDVGPLLTLHQQLEEAAATLGFTRESRPFRPHVTIARSPDRPRIPFTKLPGLLDAFPGPDFVVTSLTLMQSDLALRAAAPRAARPSGPVYTPIAHFPLSP